MKRSELKEKIREEIISQLSEETQEEVSEQEDVDVDVDIDKESDDIDVDVDDEVVGENPRGAELVRGEEPGLSQEEEDIQNALKIAYDQAKSIGDEKLADQIGNSITFFTRSHVVTGR